MRSFIVAADYRAKRRHADLEKWLAEAPLHSRPAEAGIAEMMAGLYRHPLDPITEARLFEWHQMIMMAPGYRG